MTERKKRNIIIGSLCGVLLLMVVGYAAFSSVLKIKGTSTISSNWDIKITSIQSEVLHGTATNAKDPEGIGTLEATFETNLVSPGDSMKYTITVENQGNINAKLDKITLSEPDNEYITFETSGLTEGDKLNAGSTADLIVTVTFKDVEINKMDKSTSKLTVQLDYSQADGNGGTVGGQTAANQLIETAVTTGDGLYADEYEAGRYVYKGANPNNYITFNNEMWRILSVETDGTLKIMRKESEGNRTWDTSDTTTGRNNANNTYCQISSGTYNGCNAWTKVEGTFTNANKTGTVTQDAELNTYLNNEYYNTLNSEAQALIQTHSWGIGPVTIDNTDLAAQIADENGTTWTGNIGLMSGSDYIRANTNMEQCGNFSLNYSNKDICKTTNYIFSSVPTSDGLWTISPAANYTSGVCYVDSTGDVYDKGVHGNYFVVPALYLTSEIHLDGEGTSSNPYTIVS